MRIDGGMRVSLRCRVPALLGARQKLTRARADVFIESVTGLPFPTMYNCRECENEINQATEICPHCGADLTMSVAGSQPAAKPSLKKILLRWGILLGVLLAAIWSFLWFIVPERQGNPTTQSAGPA